MALTSSVIRFTMPAKRMPSEKGHSRGSPVVPLEIVAFPRMATEDKHPVGACVKGFEDEAGLHPAAAHDADHPDVRGILDP
jgi:hypothetical protein